jgi:lipoprotein-anchoring transpeptidase ErfK/SrfK
VKTAGFAAIFFVCAACAAPRAQVPEVTPDPSVPMFQGFPAYAATVTVARVDVHVQPSDASPVRVVLPRVNENGAPQTFLLERVQRGPDGRAWYDVLLPIRPNGSTGWVRADDVNVSGLRYALIVHLASFRLDLLDDGQRVQSFVIGVGTQNTPTPTGTYYVKELIRPPDPNTVYGHYVLGLSGFSNVLENWPDGGVIGIHGTNDPSGLGHRVSHGCIRLSNSDIERLAHLLPLGTPVTVRPD